MTEPQLLSKQENRQLYIWMKQKLELAIQSFQKEGDFHKGINVGLSTALMILENEYEYYK